MPGPLTIDADAVWRVAGALGETVAQLNQETDQLTAAYARLQSAVQYSAIGAGDQLQQAIFQLQDVMQQLQTTQQGLMTVVGDTLHMEKDIEFGGGTSGSAGPQTTSPSAQFRNQLLQQINADPRLKQLRQQIDEDFRNQRTRDLLYAMLLSPAGMQTVQFLLNYANYRATHFPPMGGDELIQWTDSSSQDGAHNDGSVIYLHPDGSNGPPAGNASPQQRWQQYALLGNYLTHESVEVYYSQVDGVPANTVPMDYLAEWKGALVQQQMFTVANSQLSPDQQILNSPSPTSLDQSYQYWRTQGDGTAYVNTFHETTNPGTDNHFLWFDTGPKSDQIIPQIGNPMGLSLKLLKLNPNDPEATLGTSLPDE